MDRLADKVVIITGAALGIGKACAIRMAEAGAAVAILDVHADEGAELARELKSRSFRARFWRCDVSKEAEVARVIGEVAAEFGGVHCLVNNAGIAGPNKPTHELTEQEWDAVQAVNVKGVFFCTKHSIPHLKRAGGGSIINLSSVYGIVGAPDVPPYHASKGAVRLMSKTDALIYASDRIRVNSIHPGFIWTPMVRGYLESMGELDAGRAATAGTSSAGTFGRARRHRLGRGLSCIRRGEIHHGRRTGD